MRSLGGLVFICCIAWIFFQGTSCASIVPPAGGPKDTLPPALLKASPPNGTVNFRGKNIVLQFDEYIDLAEVSKNLLFTPTFNADPRIEVKSRTITLTIKDSLEPNTTYTFNFGNAIKDINEGNILRDFTYRFSTGPAMDSLTLEGNVILAETGEIDSTLSVFLYKNQDDSAVIKDRPRFITRLDREGRFRFDNLPAGTFRIYALGDAGGSRRYLNKNQLFAFADSPVITGSGNKPVTLYAYREVAATRPTASGPSRPAPSNDRRLKMTTNLTANQQDILNDLEIEFERGLKNFDSNLLRLTIDSVYNPVTTTMRLDSNRRKIIIRTNWQEGGDYHLIMDKEFAEDSTGRKLFKSDTLDFATKKRSDYGNISIRLRNVDLKNNPVLQFIQNGKVILSAPVSAGSYANPLFIPGDYELRILYDDNKNGVWDPGDFFKLKRQPELVKPIDRRINVKANWDNEFEIAL